ncbi:HMG box transcription factor BBX, partial [Pseudolycoriella hygida]
MEISITKILGDWWANLDKDEKLCYTDLAKQYKDAFFTANPNFKWYKLPAPPLRTLSTRPGNTDRPLFNYPYGYDAETFTNDSTNRTNGNTSIKEDASATGTKSNRGPNVGIFKLADEAQMGGLNSLMASCDSKSHSGNNNLGEHNGELEPSNMQTKTKLTPTNRTEPFSNMRCHAAKMQLQIDHQANSHRKDSSVLIYDSKTSHNALTPTADFEDFVNGKLTTPEKNIFFEDENLKKSTRACKGKRYLEFMNSGKISPSSKKHKLNHPQSPTQKGMFDQDVGEYRSQYSAIDHMYASQEESMKNTMRKADNMECAGTLDTGDSKLFDASDFDLEEKIRALPALSLDKYLSRKRETKKKKKINAKRLVNTKSPQTIGEAKERMSM